MTDQNNLSLCAICDAEPGRCSHAAARYYDQPVRLEAVVQNGKRIGFNVHPEDRARWDGPILRAAPPAQRPSEVPKPLAQITVELEAWLELSGQLEHQLATVYDLDPLRVTRAAASVVQAAEAKRIVNPAGVLVAKLREIQAKDAPLPYGEPPWNEPAPIAGADVAEALPESARVMLASFTGEPALAEPEPRLA